MSKMEFSINTKGKTNEEVVEALNRKGSGIKTLMAIKDHTLAEMSPLDSATVSAQYVNESLMNPVYYHKPEIMSAEPIVVADSFYKNVNEYYRGPDVEFMNNNLNDLAIRRNIAGDIFRNRFNFMVANALNHAGDTNGISNMRFAEELPSEYKDLFLYVNGQSAIKDIVLFIASSYYNKEYAACLNRYELKEKDIAKMEAKCETFAKYLYNNLSILHIEAVSVYLVGGSDINDVNDLLKSRGLEAKTKAPVEETSIKEVSMVDMMKSMAKELGLKITQF